jgi:hypothetical protein
MIGARLRSTLHGHDHQSERLLGPLAIELDLFCNPD